MLYNIYYIYNFLSVRQTDSADYQLNKNKEYKSAENSLLLLY